MQKFTFEKYNFDDGAYATEKELERLEYEERHSVKKYKEQDIEKIRQEAHQKGLQEGKQEALQSIEQQTQALVSQLAQKLKAREDAEIEIQQALSVDAIRLVIGALRRLYTTLDDKIGLEEKQILLEKYLAETQEARKVIVTVHSDLATSIEKTAQDIKSASGLRAEISVRGDENLPKSDLVIDWGHGGVEKTFKRLREKIEETLLESLGSEVKIEIEDEVVQQVEAEPVQEEQQEDVEKT